MGAERILVVGGAGFVGSATAALLAAQGHQVTVFDAFQQFSDPFTADWSAALAYRHKLLGGCAAIIRGDATSTVDLLRAFEQTRPQRIVHLGGFASPPLNDLMVTSAVEASVLSVTNLLQLAARARVKRFLLASSSYVYGDFAYSPCDEDHPCNPMSVYGASKLSAEILTRALAVRFDVPCTIARMIAVYGPGDLNGKLSVQNLTRAVTGGVLAINGLPGEVTDYTYIDDVVDGLCRALFAERAMGATINLARGRGWTADEVVEVLASLGHEVMVEASGIRNRPRRGVLAIERARDLLGFDPRVDLEEGLARCLEFVDQSRWPQSWYDSQIGHHGASDAASGGARDER